MRGSKGSRTRAGRGAEPPASSPLSPRLSVAQIVALDLVFSLDSVITAVGMASQVPVMMIAVVIAVLVMLVASEPVSRFINRHPTVKMLAFSFLLLIGMTLIADGFGAHVPKGYIYAAIGFSAFVELLNQLARRKRSPAGERAPDLSPAKSGSHAP